MPSHCRLSAAPRSPRLSRCPTLLAATIVALLQAGCSGEVPNADAATDSLRPRDAAMPRDGDPGSDVPPSDATTAADGTTMGGTDAEPGGTDGGTMGGTDSAVPGTDGGPVLPECDSLAPASDPAANVASIQRCLDVRGHAFLRAGATYNLAPTTITIGAGGVLAGLDAASPAVLRPSSAAVAYSGIFPRLVHLLSPAGSPVGGALRNVTIDMRDARAVTAGRAVHAIWVEGDRNAVTDVEVTSTPINHRDQVARALYFHHGVGNVATRVNIHHTAFGVYFGGMNTAAMAPTFDRGIIFHNRGDSVTLAGYGRVTNSTIHENGWDDGDNPATGTHLPPGGALYASGANRVGGVIEGNQIYDQCGANIELGHTTGFTVARNSVYQPGWTGADGTGCPTCQTWTAADFCHATMSVLLFASDHLTVTENNVENSHRSLNSSHYTGNADDWFGAGRADLPAPDSTTMALALLEGRRHCNSDCSVYYYAVGSTFTRNSFSVTNVSTTGLAWFVGRDTGFDAGGVWSDATANIFDDNTHCNAADTACTAAPYSVRYGRNRYGTGSTCRTATGANLYDGPSGANRCNRDDFTHVGPSADASRNDDVGRYHY